MLRNVKATNFISWENLDFDFSDQITLIDGWNQDDNTSEGSGKSSVLHAVSWGLYGKIPKESNIDDVIKHGEKRCSVTVTLEDYQITRTRNPNNLEILKLDTKTKLKGKDAKETQSLVESIVGLSFEAFCQSIYFAQNGNKKSFLASNQEERGKILSEVQDLEVFTKSRREVQNLLKLENQNSTQLKNSLVLLRGNKDLVEKRILQELEKKEFLEKQHTEKLTYLTQDLENHKIKRNALVEELRTLAEQTFEVRDSSEIKRTLDSIYTQISSLQGAEKRKNSLLGDVQRNKKQAESIVKSYNKTKDEIESLKTFIQNPTKECPTCKSLLENCDTTHAEDSLKKNELILEDFVSELTEISNNLKELESEIASINSGDLATLLQEKASLQASLDEIEAQTRAFESNKNKINYLGTQKLSMDKEIEAKESDLLSEKTNKPLFDDSTLTELKVELESLESKISVEVDLLDKSLKYINNLELLKKGFKDVKSFIFNSLLNELNARVKKYLFQLFDVPVTLKFVNDNLKLSTEATINGNSQGLGLFSGGQYTRISLAVDLAMADIVSSRKGDKLKVLILDEYFKFLSEQKMEKCLNLLQARKQPIVIIEHNSIFKSIVSNTFIVNYSAGTSDFRSKNAA